MIWWVKGLFGLSARLMLLVVVALVPLVLVEAYLQFDLRRAREIEIRTQVQRSAMQIAAETQRVIDGVKQLLQTLVEVDAVRDRDAARCTALLDSLRPHFEGFGAFGVTNSDGDVFCLTGSQHQSATASLGDRSYFIDAMRTGQFVVGEYSVGRFTQQRVISFALPYLDRAGARGGVVAISVALDWLAAKFDGPGWSDGQAMSIADRNGTVLIRHPNNDTYVGRKVSDWTWALAAGMTAPASRESTSVLDGQVRLVGIVPPSIGPGGFFVAVGVNRDFAFHDLNVASLTSMVAAAIAIILSLALAWLFGQELIRKPATVLIETTRKWRTGEYGARTNLTGSSDIEELGRSFDSMADALEEALQHKDMLLSELSHRVMNSLQTIAGLFSLQANQLRDPQAREQFANAVKRINSVALAYRRMQASAGVELIDFAAFLGELCADLQNSMMPDSAPCVVQADPIMLGTDQAMPLALVVNELITNALKHGGGGTPVTVLLGRSTDGCRLAVRNAGVLPITYNPETTTGFGMRMVSRIVKQLNGKLEASSMGGQTEFAVSFVPLAPQPTILSVIAGDQANPETARASIAPSED